MQYGRGGKLNAVTGLLLLSQTPCESSSLPAEQRSPELQQDRGAGAARRDGDWHPTTHGLQTYV